MSLFYWLIPFSCHVSKFFVCTFFPFSATTCVRAKNGSDSFRMFSPEFPSQKNPDGMPKPDANRTHFALLYFVISCNLRHTPSPHTTTQMFRAPEMVDLFSAKKLTQATDVWALGCCLYSMAFLQNCFEEGAILSRNYKIPEDNPYSDGLVELIDRMLTIDVKARCDMTEVILCLSAVYSGRPLPPRKEPKSSKKDSKRVATKRKPKLLGPTRRNEWGPFAPMDKD